MFKLLDAGFLSAQPSLLLVLVLVFVFVFVLVLVLVIMLLLFSLDYACRRGA